MFQAASHFKPTPSKKSKEVKPNESFSASSETWDKPSTPVKNSQKASTYIKGKVLDYKLIEDSKIKQKPRTVTVRGRRPEDGSYPQGIHISKAKLDEILTVNSYIDSEIVDAALSLVDRKLAESNIKDVKIYSITDFRMILTGVPGLVKDRYFVAVLPRKFAIAEETALIRKLKEGEVGLSVNVIHYTLVSNINCKASEVNVYETLPAYRNAEHLLTEDQLEVLRSLTKTDAKGLQINCINVLPQRESECGAICIALAEKLCFTAQNEKAIFQRINNARKDLVECLKSNELIEFSSQKMINRINFREVLFSCKL